jgi:hypothetical protein
LVKKTQGILGVKNDMWNPILSIFDKIEGNNEEIES